MSKVTNNETPKETEKVVGRPGVTDNINDQYYRDPPHNLDSNMSDRKSAGLKTGGLTEPLEPNAPPGAELGRVKKATELAEMTQESSVHP